MLKFLKFLVFLLLLSLLIKGAFIFFSKDFFKIIEVKVEGNDKLIQKDITNKMLEIKDKKNLIYINSKKIENYLKQDVRIKNVKVQKVYPSRLVVKIEENTPYAYLRNGSKYYIINNEGAIFAYINESVNKDIPVIVSDDQNELADILHVLAEIKDKSFFDSISEIKKVKNDYEILLNDGTLIKTSIVVTSEKYSNCFKLYKSLINENKEIEYIDLRFKDINLKEKDLLQTNLEGKDGRDPK